MEGVGKLLTPFLINKDMFVLREVLNSGEETNRLLGNTYSLFRRGQESFERIGREQKFADSVTAVITTDDGIYPIVAGRRTYVMQENGATFARVDIPLPSRKDIERTREVWDGNKDKEDW